MSPRLDEHLMTIAVRQFRENVKISGEKDMINGGSFLVGKKKKRRPILSS